jgi:CBS domain-containing protein
MKVKEIMAQPVITVNENTSLAEVASTILQHRIGGVPVVNAQGALCGIITESDFAAKEKGIPFSTFRMPQLFGQWLDQSGVERLYAAACTKIAADIMRAQVITVTEEASIEEVLALMLRHDVNRIPVVRDSVPVGIVARFDLLKLMRQQRQ